MEKKKIMIVDDEEEYLKLIKVNLEMTGKYDVAVFSSAKDIVSHVHMEKPDVILLDLIMPHIGGIDACKMLNDDSFACTVPLIVVSGLSKEADKLKAYKLGIVGYLVKPIELDNLIMAIEKALSFKESGT